MTVRRLVAAIAVVLVFAGASCGNERVPGTDGEAIEQLPASAVPDEILGLQVTREDMSESLAGVDDAFIESVGLYGMRRDELLQATLQISRFRDNAPMDKPSFRNSLITQIGGARAQSFRMGDRTVWRTTGRKQVKSIWFEGQTMFVLAVRDTFEQPRTLLRESLEVAA